MDFTALLKKAAGKTFMYAVMLFTIVVCTFPLLWVMYSSFKANRKILENPFALPDSINFNAYVSVFTQYDFLRYFMNSLTVAVSASAIALFIYSLAGYIFAKFDFRGKMLLFTLCTITLLVPGHTKAQPIFSMVMDLGLYDTKAGLILVYTSIGMALSLFVLRSSFMTVPRDLDEAALLDGAGFFRIFWSVNLPLARSGLATAGILMFLNYWNEYFFALMLTTSNENRTLPVALQFFDNAFSYNYTNMFAALTMAILPGILIYLLVQEQVQQSVASSGVKG